MIPGLSLPPSGHSVYKSPWAISTMNYSSSAIIYSFKNFMLKSEGGYRFGSQPVYSFKLIK